MIRRPATDSEKLTFNLNGRQVSVRIEPGENLLDTLRDRFGIVSPKNGCQPMGQCGCCTVLVDGTARLSCVLKSEKVRGKNVVTLEGLPEERRREIAECFVRTGGVQCGFCIPGIAARAESLLNKNPDATRDQIADALKGHLCRCTGYTKILDAIELMRDVRKGLPMPEPDRSGRVGTSLDRYSGCEVVLGERRFVDDIRLPGQLYGAIRFADHPRALVKSIDASAALRHPGVVRVITAADVPGDLKVGLIVRDWDVFISVGQETRYVGDVLAVVVADTVKHARRAASLIDVDYEVRTPVTNPRDALKPDAPKVHQQGNLLSRSAILRGDTERALADSAHVVEETFRTQTIEHMFLEPEACLAAPRDDGGIHVYTQGQGVFDDRRQIARVLGVDESAVSVELVSNGGAFGGKEDMTVQAQTALAAMLCGKPVKITLTREQSFRMHPKRHPIELHYRVGCDDRGRLTAIHARMIGDTGAYASVGMKVLERTGGHATGPYRVPNVDIESVSAYTNNPPCGAMRGFGVNQAAFAVESCLDVLAEKVGIDGWEMRWLNALDQGDRFCTGQRLVKPFGLKKTLLAVKDRYRDAKYAGIACAVKNVGIGNGMPDIGRASLTVETDGTITIRTGFTEMGQGLFTLCVQVACEQTSLPPETFRVVTDTRHSLDCGQTTASRGTVLAGNAIIDAADKLKADLDAGQTLDQLAGRVYRGEWICDYTNELGADVPDPKTHLTYGFATQVVILDDEGRLKKVVAAHDVGKIMNPTQLEGQLQGSIHMGLGYALTEEFLLEGGYVKSRDIRSLGVLRAHHMPEVELIFIEEPDPECPYGAKGVGEIGLVPTAPAVAAALYAFDGIRRTKLPMKDSPAAQAILNPRRKRVCP